MFRLTMIFALFFALAAVNLCARETILEGNLTIDGGLARMGGIAFRPAGVLAEAIRSCDGLDLKLYGEAVLPVKPHGTPHFFTREIAQAGKAAGPGQQTYYGVLRTVILEGPTKAGSRAIEIAGVAFVPSGPLAPALMTAQGLEIRVRVTEADMAAVKGPQTQRLEILAFRITSPAAVQAAKAEAYDRYAKRYPPINPGGPDGTYPHLCAIEIAPATGEVTVTMETFGGIFGGSLGDLVAYRFDREGQLLGEEEL